MTDFWRRLRRLIWSNLDQAMFLLVTGVGLLFCLHGKAVSDFVFTGGKSYLVRGFNQIEIYVVVTLSAALLSLFRRWAVQLRAKGPLVLAATFLLPIVVQLLASRPSMMVFFMQIYFMAAVGAIILVEEVFEHDLPTDFWKVFFDGALKGVRYVLLLFTAGVAVLQYISTGKGEPSSGFLTTLFYPTTIMILTLAMAGQWVLLPSWERLVRRFEEGKARSS